MLVKYEGRQATPGEISAYMLDLKSAKEELAVMEGYLAKHQARARRVEEEMAEVMVRLERARTMITLRTEDSSWCASTTTRRPSPTRPAGWSPERCRRWSSGWPDLQPTRRAAAGLAARREWLDQEASK